MVEEEEREDLRALILPFYGGCKTLRGHVELIWLLLSIGVSVSDSRSWLDFEAHLSLPSFTRVRSYTLRSVFLDASFSYINNF